MLLTRGLRRFISFDADAGVLRAEAGTTLGEVTELVLGRGWLPPVLPGTQFVTLGGAVANDIHGKNHHRAGSFGRHVRALGLRRSDGSLHALYPGDPLLAATVAGLGLTGLITWVEIRARARAERVGEHGGDPLPLARGGGDAGRRVERHALPHRGVD